MANVKQRIEIPGEERPLFWDVDDLLVVDRLRSDAEDAGIDWHVPAALGPSAIGRIVDELFPDPEGKRCGPARQYRIQKLVPYLPDNRQKATDVEPEATPEDEPEAHTAPGRSAGIRRALTEWRTRRAERADLEPEDEDELPERGWPILIIAGSAFVAVWSGWVGLGEMTGFGDMNLLPGFTSEGGGPLLHVNTAITLPLGIEAYAGYAIRAFINGRGARRTRIFAAISGFTALILGGFGQLAYHLLASHGYTKAPDKVTIFVSCLPVLCIGAVTALHHMLSMDRRHARRARRARQKGSSGNA